MLQLIDDAIDPLAIDDAVDPRYWLFSCYNH